MDRQVVDIASPSIVSAKNRANDRSIACGDETHSRISVQVGPDVLSGIRLAETNALAFLPQRECLIVDIHRERLNADVHCQRSGRG